MILRVVSTKSEIPKLNQNEKMVHLAFRPSNIDYLNLLKACPRLRAIQISSTYWKNMASATRIFLSMQGVDIIEGDVWGHRKDLDEYFTVEEATQEEIRALASKGMNAEEIATQIQEKARISPGLIRYITGEKADS